VKTKNSTQQNIEDTLNSLNGISKAEMPPFFYTRLQARLEKQSQRSSSWLWVTKPALSVVTLSLLLVLNIAAISYYVKSKKANVQQASGTQDFAQEYDLSVSTVYNDKNNQP
jgi:hypothetical protein